MMNAPSAPLTTRDAHAYRRGMPSIRDKISGLTFAQKIIDTGNVNLKTLQAGFMSLPPAGKEAAIDALKESGDPMLKQLAIGLNGADTIERPTFATTNRSSGGEGARTSSTSFSTPTRVASSG